MKQMDIYGNKKKWKLTLLIAAFTIGVISLSYTNRLVKEMKIEEHQKMEIWAKATRNIAKSDVENQEIQFYLNIISNNHTIPVILTNGNDSIISIINFSKRIEQSTKLQYEKLSKLQNHKPIEIIINESAKNIIYYDDSILLKKLTIYPYVQLAIVALFMFISYLAFSSSRRAEQNRVWVGLSKETAHQLGTPISSLIAWLEILEVTKENSTYIDEMKKDVTRLKIVAERFSKIGSLPSLQLNDLRKVLDTAINYMKTRTSKNVIFNIKYNCANEVIMPINTPLFYWVIENLVKNAVDAMNGIGTITISFYEEQDKVSIQIKDTGKGIPKRKQKMIFKPGYTSKERGWGLGLSLCRRIIENYHKGKIYLEESEVNQGSSFRIKLPK